MTDILDDHMQQLSDAPIPAEPPIVSLRRLVGATGGPATLTWRDATANLSSDRDTLTLSAIGTDPADEMADHLCALLSLVLGRVHACRSDIRVELTVHDLSHLYIAD